MQQLAHTDALAHVRELENQITIIRGMAEWIESADRISDEMVETLKLAGQRAGEALFELEARLK